jgi:putative selenate reductase
LAKKLAVQEYAPFDGVSVTRTQALSRSAQIDVHHVKPLKPIPSKKIGSKLPLTSCFTAPCKDACPIGQDIPEYISLVGQGKYHKAMEVIIEKNPLPFITGRICSHRCTDKCMRGHYEDAVRIRNAKLEAARNGFEAMLGNVKTPVMTGAQRVAIIGGGPAGLSAAYFIGRAGMPVTLYEKQAALGGLVRTVIPSFRISDHAIDRDILLVEQMGMRSKLETKAPSVAELKAKGYEYVVIAIGATVPSALRLETGSAINVLAFLEKCKRAETDGIQGSVCVVGGGNSAMDAARAAKRIKGVKSVSIVYRRTKRFMPAEEEELELAMKDGVQFLELLSPLSLQDGKLTCAAMRLGNPDASGRRAPVDTGERVTVNCDVLVSAVGEKVDQNYFLENGIRCTGDGYPETDGETLLTNQQGVYVIGDARGGPATVAMAIADAQKAAAHHLL